MNDNNGTTETQGSNAFRAIFHADVTVGAVETRTSATKGDYSYIAGSKISYKGRENLGVVMAFGNQRAEVLEQLVEGNTVKLALQRDGGTLRVVGFPKERAPRQAKAA
ncbi:hypothetical protein [Sphingosinicella sp. BN140058]|uniref:hypothetical protein n=1 Tax=Sphingosinicella sp. BN140058 TaxID=1892855 RepID=UPI001012209E|nr:hypothetical protein [Sphingosinicella sp. BN140058]QAY80278.1 hypothetical protein ETR14_26910 [Sphingosinicella sp. BN140058]